MSLWHWHVRTRSAPQYWCPTLMMCLFVWNTPDSASSNLPVWTFLAVCSPVTRREATVLWSSSGAQHRWLWDLVWWSLTAPFVFQHDDICLAVLGQTAYSRWQVSCPSVHWWSHSSCLQTCSLSSAATWTNALCISWKATWSESSVSCMKVKLDCFVYPNTITDCLNLDLRLDSWHFHPKLDRS